MLRFAVIASLSLRYDRMRVNSATIQDRGQVGEQLKSESATSYNIIEVPIRSRLMSVNKCDLHNLHWTHFYFMNLTVPDQICWLA
jgi:hypothetical protein